MASSQIVPRPIQSIGSSQDLYVSKDFGNGVDTFATQGIGDSLSPLLFLIFIKPFVRWLHSGGRGYRLQALQNDSLKISSLAYADDLCAITKKNK